LRTAESKYAASHRSMNDTRRTILRKLLARFRGYAATSNETQI
jgi:hypothetical protein